MSDDYFDHSTDYIDQYNEPAIFDHRSYIY